MTFPAIKSEMFEIFAFFELMKFINFWVKFGVINFSVLSAYSEKLVKERSTSNWIGSEELSKTPFFRVDPILYQKIKIWELLGQETYIHLVAQETRITIKLLIFYFFHQKGRNQQCKRLSNLDRRFRPFSMKI